MAEASPAVVEKPTAPAVTTEAPKTETPAPEAPRVYTQAEVDEITKKVRKNTEYRTKKEQEAYWRGRTEAAQPKPQPAAPEKPKEEAEPKRDAFESYEEYADARAAFVARREATKAQEEREKAQKERESAEKTAKRNAEFQKRSKEKYPDFEERIGELWERPMLPEMYEAIADSSVGHDILIHFSENIPDYERIAALSPSAQIREIGRLEARFESAASTATPPAEAGSAAPAAPAASAAPSSAPAASATSAPQVTRAPAPITPLKGGAAPAANTIRDNMPYAEFKKVRDRQLGRVK